MEVQPKIKVYLITGFLGSGKTTLLNKWLNELKAYKNLVIENEVGQVNIDALLIQEKIDQVIELSEGCVCCSLNDEFWKILSKISTSAKKPDHLFIETTGIADPVPVIDLLNYAEIKVDFSLEKVITLVDAETVLSRLTELPELAKQIAAGDLIVINKSKSVPAATLNDIRFEISKINPLASVLDENQLNTPFFELPGLKKDTFQLPFKKKDHRVIPTQHLPHAITSHTLIIDEAVDVKVLEMALSFHLLAYGHQLYRIKSIVKDPSGNYFSIQSAGKYVVTEALAGIAPEQKSVLVVIGKGLKEEAIKRIIKPSLIQ